MKSVYLFLIALVLLNVFLTIANYKQRAFSRQTVERNRNDLEAVEEAWWISLHHSGNLKLAVNTRLLSVDNRSLTIQELLAHRSPTVVLRIAQSFCTRCLDNELPKLIALSETIGKGNIILLTNYSNFEEVQRLLQLKHASFEVYSVNNNDRIFLNFEEQSKFFFPYLFTVDSTITVKSVFVINSSNPRLSASYYELLEQRWEEERDIRSITIAKKARIEFKDNGYDFGKLKLNDPVSHHFTFRNESDYPLSILSINTGCGCTAAHYPLGPVLPHDTASITIRYDAKTAGLFKREIQVFSNAIKSPAILSIAGRVE